jgi:hypothetical protein
MSESHEMEKAGASSCEPATQQFLVSNNSKPGSAGCAELVRNLIECLRCSRTDRRYSGDADSTAVGPSSLFRNRFNFKAKLFIISSKLARHSPSYQHEQVPEPNGCSVAAETFSSQAEWTVDSCQLRTRAAERNLGHLSCRSNFSGKKN